MIPLPPDIDTVAAAALSVGVEIDPVHLPLVAAGLVAVGAAMTASALSLAFEAEPAAFAAMLDAHAVDDTAPVSVPR